MTTLAPAATKLLPEVVGKALYLELTPIIDYATGTCSVWTGVDSVQQVIITPNGVDESGNYVAPVVMNRSISPTYPRAQWNFNTIEPLPETAALLEAAKDSTGRFFHYKGVPQAEFDIYPEILKKSYLTNGIVQVLKQLSLQTTTTWNEETKNYDPKTKVIWKLTNKFAVEITDEDLAKLRSHTTPQAIIRRINKVKDTK